MVLNRFSGFLSISIEFLGCKTGFFSTNFQLKVFFHVLRFPETFRVSSNVSCYIVLRNRKHCFVRRLKLLIRSSKRKFSIDLRMSQKFYAAENVSDIINVSEAMLARYCNWLLNLNRKAYLILCTAAIDLWSLRCFTEVPSSNLSKYSWRSAIMTRWRAHPFHYFRIL